MDEEIIVLSDSGSRRSSPSLPENPDLDDFDLDLPAVQFHYEPSPKKTSPPSSSFPRSDSGYSSQNGLKDLQPKEKKKKQNPEVLQRKKMTEEKRRNAQREKLLKQVERKNKQSQKPEEAIRNCRAIIDEGLRERGYLEAIAIAMGEHDATFSIATNLEPYSIIWQRTSEIYFLDDDDVIQKTAESYEENWMVVIWYWKEVVGMVSDGTFRNSIKDLFKRWPNKKVTLLIDGMEKYFSYLKGKARKKDYGMEFEKAPKISKGKLEEDLVEIQVLYDFSSQLLEGVQQVALTVYQFTKAIALIPCKEDKWKKLDDVDTYVIGEKRDLVSVSKEGYGLKRLWQKQLCQFNLCSLEIAEAICTVYPSPVQLMNAYKKCSVSEGEMLLKNIPIRRAAGPLSCVRKIGLELSKKIYIMFSSNDGDKLLGNA